MKDKAFQIALARIGPTGLDVPVELGSQWFGRWQEEEPGLEFTEAKVSGKVNLTRHGHDILVRGRLSGRLGLSCGRCLEAFAAPVEADFDLLLVPGPPPAGAEEEELTRGELDLDYYTGEMLDLEGILKEQIILMVPLKPLCSAVCRGLCPGCGANLNREACACKDKRADSPAPI
jgi:uncharacterized protein